MTSKVWPAFFTSISASEKQNDRTVNRPEPVVTGHGPESSKDGPHSKIPAVIWWEVWL